MFHSLLLEKTQNNSIYKETQILNLFLLMLNFSKIQDKSKLNRRRKVENCQLSLEYG